MLLLLIVEAFDFDGFSSGGVRSLKDEFLAIFDAAPERRRLLFGVVDTFSSL